MPIPSKIDCRNRLLALMSDEDFGLLAPSLEHRRMRRADILVDADGPIEHL